MKSLRKNGNRYTENGKCLADKLYDFIVIYKTNFNTIILAENCKVRTKDASDFLHRMYKRGIINKTKIRLKHGMINYNLKENSNETRNLR